MVMRVANEEASRRRTDVLCTVFAVLFSVGLLIAALICLNRAHLHKITFPTDSDGRTCGGDLPDHAYIYLSNPTSSVAHR